MKVDKKLRPLSQSDVESVLKKRGFELRGQYKNCHTKIKVKCKSDHLFEAKFGNLKWGGTGCPTCARRDPVSAEFVLKMVRERKGKLLGPLPTPIRNNTKLSIVCAMGHKWKVPVGKFKGGSWCRKCTFKRYSDEDLIAYLKDLASGLGRPPILSDFSNGPDYSTIMKRLNGKKNAFRLAGIDLNVATKKRSLEAIRLASEKLGTTPSRQIYDHLNLWPSGSQISKLFGGSWSKAVTAAGLKPRAGVGGRLWKVWEKTCYEIAVEIYGKGNVLKQIQFLKSRGNSIDIYIPSIKLGIDAKLSSYFHESHTNAQLNRFLRSKVFKRIEFWCLNRGSFSDSRVRFVYSDELVERIEKSNSRRKKFLLRRIRAILRMTDSISREAGLPTKKELLDDLRCFKAKHGRFPKQRELSPVNGLMSSAIYARVFGNYSNALIAVGSLIPSAYWRQLTDKQLISVFKNYVKKQCKGKVPAANEVRGLKNFPNLGVLVKRAGTYSIWLKWCNLKSRRPDAGRSRKLSKKEAIEILQLAYRESGKPLLGKGSHYRNFVEWAPPMAWYRAKFGSWNAALRAAGLPLRREV
ncbi:MAG: hypothetical protein NT027_15110 [Proteobacteria bacterium]|nr:hypothetical protein [Pseudomonadota bacterium]